MFSGPEGSLINLAVHIVSSPYRVYDTLMYCIIPLQSVGYPDVVYHPLTECMIPCCTVSSSYRVYDTLMYCTILSHSV